MSQDYDFEVEQGTTVAKLIEVFLDGETFDLTGWDARLQAREKVSDTIPVLDLDNDALGGLEVDEELGQITLTISAEVTAALDFGVAEYNLEIFMAAPVPDVVHRILRGFITLSKEFAR